MPDTTIADTISDLINAALDANEHGDARAAQSRAGILGPSDIGFCRQKAVLVTRQVQPSDPTRKWAANVGTAVHNYVEAALKETYPNWLLGSIDKITVTATLPSEATISGHPDIIAPDLNAILDIKTVDGFEWVKRNDTSDAHRFQRTLYALGAMQDGHLDSGKTLYVGNLYFDRSGKEQRPLVKVEEFSFDEVDEIDRWISDVMYAVVNKEDANRDIAPSVCQQICEFYTVCRGNLPVHEGQDFTDDPTLKSAIRMAVEAAQMEKQAKAMKSEAKSVLKGFNGTDGEFQVRWTEIAPTFIEGFQRAGSVRMDVVPLKKGK